MRRGDLVAAEVTLLRSACRHSIAVDCECEAREVTVAVAGEVFVPNNDELDAAVYAASIDGGRTLLSPTETTKAEDALIDAWRMEHQPVGAS